MHPMDHSRTSARLFGDIHDPDSEVSLAIRERGGYGLMPEWGTEPANHYLPRRKGTVPVAADQVSRIDSPLNVDGRVPGTLAALIAEAQAAADPSAARHGGER